MFCFGNIDRKRPGSVKLDSDQRAREQWTYSTVTLKRLRPGSVASNWGWLSGNVARRLWEPSMQLSSSRAFVSSEGTRPTIMALAIPRCTSVRLPAVATVVLLLVSVTTVRSSQGDKEPVYRDCVKQCVRTNCTGARLRGFQSAQPQYMALTGESLLLLLAAAGKLS